MAEFEVLAMSSPTGLSIIGRHYPETGMVEDVYTAKMTMNPETGERYLSFAPANPLALKQSFVYDHFVALGNRGVHLGCYKPHDTIVDAYLDFVDDEDRKSFMAMCYLQECGPSAEWVRKQNEARGEATLKKVETQSDGNVIKGAFAHVEEE